MKDKVPASPSLTISGREAFYRSVLDHLVDSQVPYLIGGGHALQLYCGVDRMTKDLDLFVWRADVQKIFHKLEAAGYKTELLFPHWLGKIYCARHFIDVIFSSGNGVCSVDDGWFEHAVAGEFLNRPVLFCPPEELIWAKSFVMERERYDGADVAHLLRACATRIDWKRLLARFGMNWHVLLSHLVLFSYIYSSEKSVIPSWLMTELLERLAEERNEPESRNQICRGTLL
ncbi:MAG TPA: hypothetical protein VMT22_16745, partial [Terriglobales bacterium]|nr:hypothetical protein [Terriglobales bacterium]